MDKLGLRLCSKYGMGFYNFILGILRANFGMVVRLNMVAVVSIPLESC